MEFVVLRTLRHPNVVPMLGITMTITHLTIVSDWMTNGVINQFVKAHPDTNRFELVSSSSELHLPLTITCSCSCATSRRA